MVVELLDGGVPLPGGAAEEGLPVIGRNASFVFKALLVRSDSRRIGRKPVVPDVPVVMRVGARACRGDEPLMLVGGVVEDHVEDNTDFVRTCLRDEVVHVGKGAVLGVHGFVVGDVVAEVNLRRGIHGRDPDGVHTQFLQVVHP